MVAKTVSDSNRISEMPLNQEPRQDIVKQMTLEDLF